MKPWLKSYSEGIPENISTDEFTSITDVFDQSGQYAFSGAGCHRGSARPGRRARFSGPGRQRVSHL